MPGTVASRVRWKAIWARRRSERACWRGTSGPSVAGVSSARAASDGPAACLAGAASRAGGARGGGPWGGGGGFEGGELLGGVEEHARDRGVACEVEGDLGAEEIGARVLEGVEWPARGGGEQLEGGVGCAGGVLGMGRFEGSCGTGGGLWGEVGGLVEEGGGCGQPTSGACAPGRAVEGGGGLIVGALGGL